MTHNKSFSSCFDFCFSDPLGLIQQFIDVAHLPAADVDGATDHQAGPLLFAIQHNLALERTRSASYGN